MAQDRVSNRYRVVGLATAIFAAVAVTALAVQAALAAGSPAGAVTIVKPDGTSPLTGLVGTQTPFTFKMPAGAACSKDTSSAAFHVFGYIVPSSVDPANLTFGSTGPSQGFPLVDTTGTGYIAKDTLPVSGVVQQPPTLDFFQFTVDGRAAPDGTAAHLLPAGTYNIGVACATNTGAGDKFWNTQIVTTANAADPNGFVWTQVSTVPPTTTIPPATTTTSTVSTTTTSIPGGGATTTTTTRPGGGSSTTTTTTTVAGTGGTTVTTHGSSGALAASGASVMTLSDWALLMLCVGSAAVILSGWRRPGETGAGERGEPAETAGGTSQSGYFRMMVVKDRVDRRPLGVQIRSDGSDAVHPSTTAPVTARQPAAMVHVGYVALIVTAIVATAIVLQIVVVSNFEHRSAQQSAFDRFRKELALGTAPVGPADQGHLLALGTPVALIDIPSIHVHQVVLEGTTSGVLMAGPGHKRGSPLPGQAGTSVIFGRQASYGGPFGRLDALGAGNTVVITTAQGRSTYAVIDRRYPGAPQPPTLGSGQGRLLLVTASGTPFVPSEVLRVDADLSTRTFPAPGGSFPAGVVQPAEQIMAGDTGTLWALALWLQALIVVAVGIVWSWHRWGVHQTWIVFFPLTTLVAVFVSGQALKLLPNLL